MKKSLAFLIIATQLGYVSTAAFGQQGGEMLERLFSRMDSNGDGVIEKSEAPAEAWDRIGRADRNQDGKIDKTEAAEGMRARAGEGRPGPGNREGNDNRPGARPERGAGNAPAGGQFMRQMYERLSRNGDGKIALTDVPEQMRARLNQFDKNSDGYLDREEVKGSPLGQMMQSAAPNAMFDRIKQAFDNLDKDGDGKVAVKDLPGEMKSRLERFDKNGDGQIERSELAELKNQVGEGAGQMMERMQQMFAEYDPDGDGKVAIADLPPPMQDRVAKLDSNQDGQLEKSELRAMIGEMMRAGGPGARERGSRGDGGESLAPQKPKRPAGSDNSENK